MPEEEEGRGEENKAEGKEELDHTVPLGDQQAVLSLWGRWRALFSSQPDLHTWRTDLADKQFIRKRGEKHARGEPRLWWARCSVHAAVKTTVRTGQVHSRQRSWRSFDIVYERAFRPLVRKNETDSRSAEANRKRASLKGAPDLGRTCLKCVAHSHGDVRIDPEGCITHWRFLWEAVPVRRWGRRIEFIF